MTLYRIEIDHDSCVGYGGCVKEAPDVFWLEDGLAYARSPSGCHEVIEAAELCPMSAIVVTAETVELAA